jgi:hypothetical protein
MQETTSIVEEKEKYTSLLDILLLRYIKVGFRQDIPLERCIPNMHRRIDSFGREQYKPYFRFEEEQLKIFKVDNRIGMGGEDTLLRGFGEINDKIIRFGSNMMYYF